MKKLLLLVTLLMMTITANAAEITIAKPNEPLSCISFSDIPSVVDNSWLPLVAVSGHLPISVEWDAENRAIVIDSEAHNAQWPWIGALTYPIKHLYVYRDELAVVDGVTYCSPWFIARHLPGLTFVHDGMLWYCDVPVNFDGYVFAAMTELQVVSPNDYAFVISHLPGGICAANERTMAALALSHPNTNALAHFYQNENGEPTAYIIDTTMYGTYLATAIAHEAWHAHEYMGHAPYSGEVGAHQYHLEVEARLLYELREIKGLA